MPDYLSQLQSIFIALPMFFYATIFIFGAIVGSFLNVVIYRLPKMLFFDWENQCMELKSHMAGEDINLNYENTRKKYLTLSRPRSHCPECQAHIKPWHNIPILSWLMLGGKCHSCGTKISIRYPAIETLTAILSVTIAATFGPGLLTIIYLLLAWSLIAASFIDIDHKLLPDEIIIPLVWLGLVISTTNLSITPSEAIIGAAVGYLSFWSIFHLFKIATGKEGMGHGDFKLMAIFGAFLGWKAIPLIIILSTVAGTVFAVIMMLMKKMKRENPMPFGPYIAIAGIIMLLKGDEIIQWYASSTGFTKLL